MWHGVDPDRIDAAAVLFGDGRMSARGTSLTADYALSYELETVASWVTDRIRVRVEARRWWRSLDLRRDGDGRWTATVAGERDDHLGPAGVLDPAGLAGALDCDLAFCPLTNTMPVLRHDLVAAGPGTSADFTMAWISVPDLAVHVSPQTYVTRGPAPDGGAYADFRSGTFQASLRLDRDGLVIDYPGLGVRIDGVHTEAS
ncbi:putative glycolipid-binding domain-containing protein [Fodinicola feengrottensis]|uniref:putative glycolipid-binding domain-containing protein n=1 Tax=Fodinicola feengrottensis TaxID=435914 RepID=UPI0024421791|nr:putative glycolipid-binding domain-containing protein [Fodinicola feengrottensis]